MTEDEFVALEEGNPAFEVLERVAIVRKKDTGTIALAVLRRMPDGTVGQDGEPINWRSIFFRLDPGTWEGILYALEDPALLRERIAEARRMLEIEPRGRA